MDKLVFSCFLLGGLTPDPGPTDSCALNAYCAAGLTNVGCNPPPITGGSACDGKNPQVLEILEPEQSFILYLFNAYRDMFASGSFGEPANRMFPLQWDANLATLAGHNARSCVIGRDACRNTADYANVGQMIFSTSFTTVNLQSASDSARIEYVSAAGIDFTPYYIQMAVVSSYSASTGTENLANILNDRSTKVGCAVMQWVEGDQTFFYFVCNFSANVIEGQPLYTAAATPGMGCVTKDTTYPALCLT